MGREHVRGAQHETQDGGDQPRWNDPLRMDEVRAEPAVFADRHEEHRDRHAGRLEPEPRGTTDLRHDGVVRQRLPAAREVREPSNGETIVRFPLAGSGDAWREHHDLALMSQRNEIVDDERRGAVSRTQWDACGQHEDAHLLCHGVP